MVRIHDRSQIRDNNANVSPHELQWNEVKENHSQKASRDAANANQEPAVGSQRRDQIVWLRRLIHEVSKGAGGRG